AINRCFSHDDIRAVLAALAAEEGDWAQATRAAVAAASPTSLAVTFRQLTEGRGLDFDTAIQREYGLACHFLAGHDFYEGIRAVLVDKDKSPKWRPDNLTLVSATTVDGYFSSLSDGLSFGDLN
ncbi:MAG: enoyl-CoA hydratase/isomerase family protein, partial [Magnetospirillum sp.]|nr:enoyl-CoA hydratase/isomerase family protein [Magnetospirillum sp.]